MKRTFSKTGICGICRAEVEVKQMLRHVKLCRLVHPLKEGKKEQKIFTLRVTAPEYPGYLLYLEIEGGKKLSLLDAFLRGIWLECCGHISQFTIGGEIYSSFTDREMMRDLGEQSDMTTKVQEVLGEGLVFQYEYDMGSTTYLKLEVVDVRETKESVPEGILPIIRNAAPEIQCKECKVPATKVLMDYSENHGAYCDACAEKLAEDDLDMTLPVVNSPRMGVCGYTGD